MASQYVSVHHDSFKNKTTEESYKLKYNLDARRLLLTETAEFRFRRVTVEPDLDALLIDVHFTSVDANRSAIRNGSLKSALSTYPGEWAFLRNGQLIIQVNGVENIPLRAHESGSDVTKEGLTNASACEELVYYEINRDILEKICKANSLRMQLSGSAGEWTLDGSDMILLAKAFYNGVYDESMYADELSHAADVEQARAGIKKRGCFIEVLSVCLAFIIINGMMDDYPEVAYVLGLIFMFVIPIFVAIRRRKKAKEVK